MAISLEIIKLIFSTGYPFLKGRHKKNECAVLLTMKICFVLSVMASMYYLMLGKDITRSPASKTVMMLYEYVPFVSIIPLKFSQFITTISLTILIEFFIVFLPVLAPVMFYEKDFNRKIYTLSNLDKIKEMLVTIPDRYIDRLYKRVMGDGVVDSELKVVEMKSKKKPGLKLLKNDEFRRLETSSNNLLERTEEEYENNIPEFEGDSAGGHLRYRADDDSDESSLNTKKIGSMNSSIPLQDRVSIDIGYLDKKIVLRAIYKLKDNGKCPSVKQLIEATGFKRNSVYEIKREFEDAGILKTDGFKTTILDTYKSALSKLKSRNSE